MNLCPDWYGKNVPVIQSVVYCFGCEEKGRGRGRGGGVKRETRLSKFLDPKKGKGGYLRVGFN